MKGNLTHGSCEFHDASLVVDCHCGEAARLGTQNQSDLASVLLGFYLKEFSHMRGKVCRSFLSVIFLLTGICRPIGVLLPKE